MSDKIAESSTLTEKPFQREAAEEANRTIAKVPGGTGLLSDPELGAEILDKYQESEELKAENVRDPLTGAFNRRFFDRQLEINCKADKRFPLS